MNISIDYQSRTPIYEQIVKGVEKLVILNVLKPNEQIPSIRELACSLGINPNTVKKAYSVLESKNVIVSLSTKGTFISSDVNSIKNTTINNYINDIKSIMNKLNKLGLDNKEIIDKIK